MDAELQMDWLVVGADGVVVGADGVVLGAHKVVVVDRKKEINAVTIVTANCGLQHELIPVIASPVSHLHQPRPILSTVPFLH